MVFDANLNLTQTVAIALPMETKTGNLYDFALDNNGLLYFLTKANLSKADKKNDKDEDNLFQLHQINTRANNSIKTFPIAVSGKIINEGGLFIKNGNEVFCFGTYYDADNKKSNGKTTGAWSAFLNTNGANNINTNQLDIPQPIRKDMEPYEKSAKDGLRQKFSFQNALSDNDGGLLVVMRCDIVKVTVRGTTGAMNSYQEQTFSNLFLYVDRDRKIKWVNGSNDFGKNDEMATRIDRRLYYFRNNQFNYVFIRNWKYENEPMGLYEASFDKNNGNINDQLKYLGPLPAALSNIRIVDNTLYPLPGNEFIVTTIGNQVGFLKL